MLGLARQSDNLLALRNDVAAYLDEAFAGGRAGDSYPDRWTQHRIIADSTDKLEQINSSDDPVACCYGYLVREIDTEAESGIYLVGEHAESQTLRELATDASISGLLGGTIDCESEFEALKHRYARANIEAGVSEALMKRLAAGTEYVADMSTAIRSLMYAYHEDTARDAMSLPRIIDSKASIELTAMVSNLRIRAADSLGAV